jgi:hypothetical protein
MTRSAAVRIQRSHAKGWRMPEGALSVTRPGPFGNPWIVGPPSAVIVSRGVPPILLPMTLTARGAVDRFRRWLSGEFGDVAGSDHPLYGLVLVPDYRHEMLSRIGELRGRDLACWCPIISRGVYVPCHADVLLELVNS